MSPWSCSDSPDEGFAAAVATGPPDVPGATSAPPATAPEQATRARVAAIHTADLSMIIVSFSSP